MSESPVLINISERIALLTLNRPDNRNSMDGEMMPAFKDAIQQIKDNDDLRCLIITGSGNSFCAGADFKQGLSGDKNQLPNETFMEFYQPFLDLGEITIPVIGALNGHAIGGGLGLALMCDIRIANKSAKYGANFVRLGIHSGMAISYLVPRLVGLPMANELLFTGRLITGEKSCDIGLVNYAENADEVLDKAWELAREIAACAPVAVKMMKRSIYRGLSWNPSQAAELEAHCQSRTFEMEDAKEGIHALLEKREPNFKGI